MKTYKLKEKDFHFNPHLKECGLKLGDVVTLSEDTCGGEAKPTDPPQGHGPNGDWYCRDGKWTWIDDFGG